MKVMAFRYNRYHSTISLVILLGIFWIFGFLFWSWLINNYLGFHLDSYEGIAPFWRERIGWALVAAIVPPLIWMIVAVFPAKKIWLFWMEGQGRIEISRQDAVLYYGNRQIRFDQYTKISYQKVDFNIRASANGTHPIVYRYRIEQDGESYFFTESLRELYQKISFSVRIQEIRAESSLYQALMAIPFITMNYETTPLVQPSEELLWIGEVAITTGETKPDIFDGSPYYVDYQNPERVEGVPLTCCYVRERSNPEHVVGEIGWADDPEHIREMTEELLRHLPIIDGVALDEVIEIGPDY
ncbi:hypothetical protein EII17_06960 [Clostridiales bacterium COT073_COT-073]|nr:hypothetical protein EII17_06960 [Clostridiales bacterium COT073_COT-073]